MLKGRCRSDSIAASSLFHELTKFQLLQERTVFRACRQNLLYVLWILPGDGDDFGQLLGDLMQHIGRALIEKLANLFLGLGLDFE